MDYLGRQLTINLKTIVWYEMSENVGKCALNPRANCLFCLINSPVANLLVVADFHILEA